MQIDFVIGEKILGHLF